MNEPAAPRSRKHPQSIADAPAFLRRCVPDLVVQ
jgi:hypothetical protein